MLTPSFIFCIREINNVLYERIDTQNLKEDITMGTTMYLFVGVMLYIVATLSERDSTREG